MNSNHRNKTSTGMLAVAGATAAAVLLAPRPARATSTALTFADIPGTGNIQVLNYALALEDLEADLYSQALKRLTTGGTNALGTTIPGLNLATSEIDVAYIQEFGAVEAEHRDFLRGTLGSAAISQFKYNFGMESLDRAGVDNLIFSAEASGVNAYLGAIPLLTNRTYLLIAGAILGTEARHTAVITATIDELFGKTINVAPLATQNNGRDTPVAINRILARVSPFIVT